MIIEISDERIALESDVLTRSAIGPNNFRLLKGIHRPDRACFDGVDACFWVGDSGSNKESRPDAERMVTRWVRRLIEETVWDPKYEGGDEENGNLIERSDESIRAEQRETAIRFIANIIEKCQLLGIDLSEPA